MTGVLSADISALRAIGDELAAPAAAVRGFDGSSLARWTRGPQAPGDDASRRGQSVLTVAGVLKNADFDAAAAANAVDVAP